MNLPHFRTNMGGLSRTAGGIAARALAAAARRGFRG
jgi:hypothetical protein